MKPFSSIIIKDIVIELRNKESLSSMLMFGLMVLVVFNFAFAAAGVPQFELRAAVLWIAFSFAGILGLNRSLAMELDNDCLQGLLLAPLSRGDLYLGKVASNYVFMMLSELMILPPFVLFYNLAIDTKLLWIIAIAALGTLGFVAVGTILSLISANTRMREVMLPLLQIPMMVPVVIAAVESTTMILADEREGISTWLSMLGGFSIVYLLASYLMFEYAVEE
ncbi:MAG: heme exporter protein CcmB [Acidobacteria bacterium]|nr:heme exporter protein CcmB [Acidobacteriota bacterium]